MTPWPPDTFSDDLVVPPTPCLELRQISDLELAFPAGVNPDLTISPPKYWRDGEVGTHDNPADPWVRLASQIFHSGFDATRLKLPTRTTDTGEAAWKWALACMRSYELRHEHKRVAVAWILESFFYAYWLEGAEPDWALAALTDPTPEASP